MRKKLSIITLVALLLSCGILQAQEKKNHTDISFRQGVYMVEVDFDDNQSNLDELVSELKAIQDDPKLSIRKLKIIGYASPEGGHSLNMDISNNRIITTEKYIRDRVQISDSLIYLKDVGVDWARLREKVLNSDMKYREEVLSIMDNFPEEIHKDGKLVDIRNNKLMALANGEPYKYMEDNFFSELRHSMIITYYYDKSNDVEEAEEKDLCCDTSITYNYKIMNEPKAKVRYQPKLVIKTNLLYDLILAPNVGLEYYFNPSWSLGFDVTVPWWRSEEKHTRYRMQLYELEGRYYMGAKKRHHVGVFVQGGLYDLKRHNRAGYKGEFGGVSIGYGYLLPIKKRLSMDFEVGLGYIYTEYDKYDYNGRGNFYQKIQKERSHIFMPTRAGVSLVWIICKDNKRGGKL